MNVFESSQPLRRYGVSVTRNVRDVVRFMLRRADEENLFQVASSLTFTTVLSLVPLATTVFAVLTALPVFNRVRDALHSFFESHLLPEALSASIFKYLDTFSANASSLTIVSVLSFAVTSLTTMLTIDAALNKIWAVRQVRPLPQRLVTYWAILTIGPVLLGTTLTLASYLARVSAGLIAAPPPLVTTALDLLSIVLFTLSYAALYVFVPNRRVEWRDALIGAFVAALAFEAARRGFAIYITRFRTVAMVYGTLAAVPLLLLWIYYIWIITLAGATIAASLPALYGRNWNRGQGPGDAYGDALRILRALYRARRVGRPPQLPGLGQRAIGQAARIDYQTAADILGRLEQDGLVIRTRPLVSTGSKRDGRAVRNRRHGRDDLWVFAADPSVVSLERVFRLFAFDPAHVAGTAFERGDPLAGVIAAQRLADGDRSLEQVFGEPANVAAAVDGRLLADPRDSGGRSDAPSGSG